MAKHEMFKYETTNELINEMVKSIIKNHLSWTGSAECVPSSRRWDNYYDFEEAYFNHCFEMDANLNENCSDEDEIRMTKEFSDLADKANSMADKKWAETMRALSL